MAARGYEKEAEAVTGSSNVTRFVSEHSHAHTTGKPLHKGGLEVRVPSVYVEGYEKARRHDPAAAENYIRHTTMGDSELDPIMEELSSLPPADLHRFIRAGIEQQDEVLARAPRVLRDFFETVEKPPPWLDHDAFRPGIRAFHANVDLMLVAFVTGVLVEGFSTLIAKSSTSRSECRPPTDASSRTTAT